MKTIEIFSGTESFSKVARKLGHNTFTIDNNPNFNSNLIYDFMEDISINIWEKIEGADIVWMSPPCTTFSMASGNTHWTAERKPKTIEAKKGLFLLNLCRQIANYCIKTNKIFFIENPRARARWFLPKKWRKTVWYCKYGDKRAKPTDIWTNLDEWKPKICHNMRKGSKKDCHHELAPRGSKTGTQGLKGNMERGVIPAKLFYEIFKVIGNRKVKEEFDLDRVYTKVLAKEKLLEIIRACYDKEFIVSFLPRKSDNADILIRSKKEELKK